MRNSEQIIEEIRDVMPVIQGSLIVAKRTCGNKRCRCARGEPHSAFYLSRSIKGKTKLEHVSKADVETVRQWSLNHGRLVELVEELTGALVQELREERKKKREREK